MNKIPEYAQKYNRTYHLPFSECVHSDDKVIDDLSVFEGKIIVATEKLDGESTSMYRNYMHARSMDSAHNFTRDWVKKLHSILKNDIPEGYRFIFENVAYFHSIEYHNLESFAYLLSIWDDKNYCLSFKDKMEWADILDLATPQVFYKGVFDIDVLQQLAKDIDKNKIEGFVIANVESFHESEFSQNMAKFVRGNHVQPNHETGEVEHWLKNTYPNKLADKCKVKPFFMQ